MEDVINRAHLLSEIAALKKSPWYNDNTNGAAIIRKEAVEMIEDLCIKREPPVYPEPSKDAISRAAAHELIKGMTRWNVVKENYKSVGLLYDDVQFGLDKLPPVQPEQEPDYWIHRNDDYNDWLECPKCGYGSEGEVKFGEGTSYCPHCGKRLEEEKRG